MFPRGGLLGGSSNGSKPSKLAQLAAARKKKGEGKKAQTSESHSSSSSSNALSLLDRLGGRSSSNDHAESDYLPSKPKRQDSETPQSSSAIDQLEPQGTGQISDTLTQSLSDAKQFDSKLGKDGVSDDALKAEPSSFALTMTGFYTVPKRPPSMHRPEPIQLFQVSGSNNEQLAEANRAFLGPSPDDAVEQAQAKGMRHLKTVLMLELIVPRKERWGGEEQ